MTMFTRGQAERMAATLAGPRSSLLTSPALHAPEAAAADHDFPPTSARAGQHFRHS
jgi:hypothetical protein